MRRTAWILLFAAALPAAQPVPSQASGTWAGAGRLVSAANEAYLLHDGRVFVPASDLVGTVGPQIGDPATSTWVLAPPNIYGRIGSASVVLNDGRVLVTGGQSSMSTAELYDPAANTWRLTAANMTVGRYFHRLTKLNDGRVLLTGGCSAYGCATATAVGEIYDPATDAFTQTGAMRLVRTFHTANLLNDGRALIAGGYTNTGTGVARVAEIYDPATGAFTITGKMLADRAEHTGTTMLDGRVLVTGGSSDNGTILASAEVFDPSSGKWTKTGTLPARMYEHSAILLAGGKVLVCGGYSIKRDAYVVLRAAETFDPSTGVFTLITAMRQPRLQFGLVMLQDGRVMAAGGDYAVVGPHRIFYGDAEAYQP